MARFGRHQPREPHWPAWVYSSFTPNGIEFLKHSYSSLKTTRPVPRATRISAEDYASATVAVLQALGRLDLVRA